MTPKDTLAAGWTHKVERHTVPVMTEKLTGVTLHLSAEEARLLKDRLAPINHGPLFTLAHSLRAAVPDAD